MTPIRIAIIASAYNRWITDPMTAGAREALSRLARDAECEVFEAPGAFELPVLAASAIDTGRFDAVVCLGCIIKGETRHDEVIADAIANAIQNLACQTGIPVAFGVLTTNTAQEAEARAGGAKGNKGAEAMEAALATLFTIEQMNAKTTATEPARAS